MADKLLFRGGGTANIASSTVADREIVIDTDTNEIVVNSDKVRTLMQSSGGDVAVTGHVAIGQAVVADNIFRSTSDGVYNIVAKSNRSDGLGTDHNFTGLDASDTVTSIITRDGTIKLGGVTNTAPNIELNNAGSITAKGGTSFTAANSGSAQTVLSRWTSDHYTTNGTVCTIAGDGSIIANGYVLAGASATGGTGTGAYLLNNGVVSATRGGNNVVWSGYQTNSSTATSSITASGQATFTGTINGVTVGTSDERFKKNIAAANSQLADVKALGGLLKNFDWNEDAPVNDEIRATRQLGLIAQEVEKVCPTLTKTIVRTKQGAELTPETTDEEGNVTPATYEDLDDSYKGISHDALIMKLLGAVAELSAKVEALESA